MRKFSTLIILFGDSTLEELRGKLTFGPGERNNDLRSQYREALAYLGKDDKQSLDPDVAVSLLNGEHNDLFYAHMMHRGTLWMYMINPHEVEVVRLLTQPRGVGMVRFAEVLLNPGDRERPVHSASVDRSPGSVIMRSKAG